MGDRIRQYLWQTGKVLLNGNTVTKIRIKSREYDLTFQNNRQYNDYLKQETPILDEDSRWVLSCILNYFLSRKMINIFSSYGLCVK